MLRKLLLGAAMAAGWGCHRAASVAPTPGTATLARVYFWKARPGKFAEYTRYIREFAEPIDHEAQRRGAFLSITTTVDSTPGAAWTHRRVFTLRDSAQLLALGHTLDAAGVALEPDSVKRQARSAYAATLRDLVGQTTVALDHGRLPPLNLSADTSRRR